MGQSSICALTTSTCSTLSGPVADLAAARQVLSRPMDPNREIARISRMPVPFFFFFLPKSQPFVFLDVSRGTSSSDLHVATHQQRADGGARLDWLGLLLCTRPPAQADHGAQPLGSEAVLECVDGLLAEAAEEQRCFDRPNLGIGGC